MIDCLNTPSHTQYSTCILSLEHTDLRYIRSTGPGVSYIPDTQRWALVGRRCSCSDDRWMTINETSSLWLLSYRRACVIASLFAPTVIIIKEHGDIMRINLLTRPHCCKRSDEIQQTNLRPRSKTTGFRYCIENKCQAWRKLKMYGNRRQHAIDRIW